MYKWLSKRVPRNRDSDLTTFCKKRATHNQILNKSF